MSWLHVGRSMKCGSLPDVCRRDQATAVQPKYDHSHRPRKTSPAAKPAALFGIADLLVRIPRPSHGTPNRPIEDRHSTRAYWSTRSCALFASPTLIAKPSRDASGQRRRACASRIAAARRHHVRGACRASVAQSCGATLLATLTACHARFKHLCEAGKRCRERPNRSRSSRD